MAIRREEKNKRNQRHSSKLHHFVTISSLRMRYGALNQGA